MHNKEIEYYLDICVIVGRKKTHNKKMKVYVNGFWPGFIEKTDIHHVGFFIDLFKKVFNKEIEISNSIHDCQILLESIFTKEARVNAKQWDYTFLFSGASHLNNFEPAYDCVLWGERTHDNIVNCPLYVSYLHCANLFDKISAPIRVRVPPKNICAVVSNQDTAVINNIINKIHCRIPVDKYGDDNIQLVHAYNTQEFRDIIGEYKFVIAMDTSVGDAYITEKITHGLLANTIPIYWGSQRVGDYFNTERFIHIPDDSEETLNRAIDKIEELCNNDKKYLEMLNKKAIVGECNVDTIACEVRNRIFPKAMPSIDKVYFICSKEFEPLRYDYLKTSLCKQMGLREDNVIFKCPTYGHTITNEKRKNV